MGIRFPKRTSLIGTSLILLEVAEMYMRNHAMWSIAMVILISTGAIFGLSSSSIGAALKGSIAPCYSKSLPTLGVRDKSGKSVVAQSLKSLAAGRKVILYFWSGKDTKMGDELRTLADFQPSHQKDYAVVAIAFPVGGDEHNVASRTKSAAYPRLNIIFDDRRSVYSQYCTPSKSECRSTFILDKQGRITDCRTGTDRVQGLSQWLKDHTRPVDGRDDINDHPYSREIRRAIGLKYMSLGEDGRFRPNDPIHTEDFVGCIKKAMAARKPDAEEDQSVDLPEPEKPRDNINKMQAAKFLVAASLTPQQFDTVCKRCGNPVYYLSDFLDVTKVAQWAMPYVAASVYSGWMPDTYSLQPDQPIGRGYAAALLVRAFPDSSAKTGLIVKVPPDKLERAQSLRIVCDEADAESGDADVYLEKGCTPSLAFVQAPGVIGYCKSEDEARQLRVGSNPVVVEATDVRRGYDGRWELVISSSAAKEIRDADQKGLFLKMWRVAVVGMLANRTLPTAKPQAGASDAPASGAPAATSPSAEAGTE